MNNNLLMNRLFTISSFKSIIMNKKNSVYPSCLKMYNEFTPGSLTNLDFIKKIYQYMSKEYRNEYIYKNTILNTILLGVHSINTTVALSEIPINKSQVDMVLINGRAIAYEIKTELDNLDRLPAQINDYYSAFDHVCVVTHEKNYIKLLNILQDSPVGIYVLNSSNSISKTYRKEPMKYSDKLNHKSVFNILRQKEYYSIVKEFYGSIPTIQPLNMYSECLELFTQIPINIAYDLSIKEIKKRKTVLDIDSFNSIPDEIKFIAYFSKFTSSDYNKLDYFLNKKIY